VIWRDFEAAAPTLAELGRARFERSGVAVLATLRRDGSPRVSPVEPHVVLGHLLFGIMRSAKRHDLLRDPRSAIHSAISDPNGSDGEFKVHGRAELIVDPLIRDGDYDAWWRAFPVDASDVFSMDLEGVAFVQWDFEAAEVRVQRWSASGGLRVSQRSYP
jgi:hypothetical protein